MSTSTRLGSERGNSAVNFRILPEPAFILISEAANKPTTADEIVSGDENPPEFATRQAPENDEKNNAGYDSRSGDQSGSQEHPAAMLVRCPMKHPWIGGEIECEDA